MLLFACSGVTPCSRKTLLRDSSPEMSSTEPLWEGEDVREERDQSRVGAAFEGGAWTAILSCAAAPSP